MGRSGRREKDLRLLFRKTEQSKMQQSKINAFYDEMITRLDLKQLLWDWAMDIYAKDFYAEYRTHYISTALMNRQSDAMIIWTPRTR
jgi:hypothetical protein